MSNWNPPPPGSPPGAPPPGGYGGPPGPAGPPPGGYGAPPPAGGYGAPPPAGGFGAPPPGGYGNPYAAPQAYGAAVPVGPGSIPLGFLAGFFGGCIGLILVLAIAKTPETKKGAWIGFAAQVVLGGIFRVIANS